MGRYDRLRYRGGSSWVQPEQVKIWDGSSWVDLGLNESSNTTVAAVYDGSGFSAFTKHRVEAGKCLSCDGTSTYGLQTGDHLIPYYESHNGQKPDYQFEIELTALPEVGESFTLFEDCSNSALRYFRFAIERSSSDVCCLAVTTKPADTSTVTSVRTSSITGCPSLTTGVRYIARAYYATTSAKITLALTVNGTTYQSSATSFTAYYGYTSNHESAVLGKPSNSSFGGSFTGKVYDMVLAGCHSYTSGGSLYNRSCTTHYDLEDSTVGGSVVAVTSTTSANRSPGALTLVSGMSIISEAAWVDDSI